MTTVPSCFTAVVRKENPWSYEHLPTWEQLFFLVQCVDYHYHFYNLKYALVLNITFPIIFS